MRPVKRSDPQAWALAGGIGWLYGIGCVLGPFYGVGVGLTFPGGILAGAGGGVGVVVGIGMGGGLVWGAGRGSVRGLGVPVPMEPPVLPSLQDLGARAATSLEAVKQWRRELSLAPRPGRSLALALPGAPIPTELRRRRQQMGGS
mmetsp:Transcript_9735/g.30845  ORF Transcript_9735/g.30845 Transcript_9735/m.30845 type:complete len:145 (-) Transcript_9735:85-519(-)